MAKRRKVGVQKSGVANEKKTAIRNKKKSRAFCPRPKARARTPRALSAPPPRTRRLVTSVLRRGMASASSAGPAGGDIVIPLMDDLHLHLRDGAAASSLLAALPATVARALIMPNLKPPVVTAADVAAYGARLAGWLPAGSRFQPLMSLYLTDRTDAVNERARARAAAYGRQIAASVQTHFVENARKSGAGAVCRQRALCLSLLPSTAILAFRRRSSTPRARRAPSPSSTTRRAWCRGCHFMHGWYADAADCYAALAAHAPHLAAARRPTRTLA